MVRWLQIMLLLCSLALPALARPPYDSPESTAAQDGTGTVWKLPGGGDGTLDCWQDGAWTAQAVPDTTGFRPLALTRGSSGFVYVLWQHQSQWKVTAPQCLVTVQRGVGSRILARFPGPAVRESGYINTPAIFAGTDKDVWVTGSQPLLWHIERDGSARAFPLKPEQYAGGRLPDPDTPPLPPLRSLVDPFGHRWFWQDPLTPGNLPGGLHGVLIWNGASLDYHSTLPGLPDLPISAAAPLDAGHLWLATAGSPYSHDPNAPQNALYRVDTRTLSAAKETPPRPGAFRNITQMFAANGDWYVAENNQAHFASVLWRKRAGVWSKIIAGLEALGSYRTPDLRHPWVAEPAGTWLGAAAARGGCRAEVSRRSGRTGGAACRPGISAACFP